MENKIRHLEMIVRIIERMEKNSFLLKGWVMTLVVAIIALSSNNSEKKFVLIALIPEVIFWLLDSFYLQIERKYRILYKNVAEKKEEQIDFNMDLNKIIFIQNEKEKITFINCLLSFSEVIFYIPLILLMVVIIFILKIF